MRSDAILLYLILIYQRIVKAMEAQMEHRDSLRRPTGAGEAQREASFRVAAGGVWDGGCWCGGEEAQELQRHT